MPSYTHSHPNSLGASWWAPDHTSNSSSNSYGHSNALYDTTNRPQQQRDHDPRRDRNRPRMRQRPHIAPLGTREDVENEDYVSPLSTMFHRAHDRYRVAEETRRQAHQVEQYMTVNDENTIPNPLRSRQSNATDNYAGQHEFPGQFNYAMPPPQAMVPPQAMLPIQAVTYPWIQNAHAELDRRRLGLRDPEVYMAEDTEIIEALRLNELRRREQAIQLAVHAVSNVQPIVQIQAQQPAVSPQTTVVTFENQQRPPPKASEDMVVNIACTICAEHPINVVLLPCWHACMCNWCADLCVPVRRNTPFARPPTGFTGKCPKCRAVVKERREMFLG
jgi:hypothetical protein